MSIITYLLQQSWVYSLGWTLVHSLWQSAAIAGICMALLFLAKNASAHFRYLTALAALVSCLLASAATFYHYQFFSVESVSTAKDAAPLVQAGVSDTGFDFLVFLGSHMNSIVLLWLLGFTLCALKAGVEYRYCQRIKNTNLVDTPEKWQRVFGDLCNKVGISKLVELRVSTRVIVPCVIGHLKPVVLIPLGLLLSMNQQQIEAILLHELGHVRRNDYLLAIVQAISKSLFFFNPFLLWISNQMDREREHACDDIAVTVSQDPLLFANTLKEFAEMNSNIKPAMSIHDNKFLLARITRLFNRPKKSANAKNSLIATLLIVITGGVLSLCVNANTAPEKTVTLPNQNLPIAEAYAAAMAQVNQQCGVEEKLGTLKAQPGTKNFNVNNESLGCEAAIKRIKKSFFLDNLYIPEGTKRVDIYLQSQPVNKVLAEVNKQCGINESVPDTISSDLISLNFKQIDCVTVLQIIKEFEVP